MPRWSTGKRASALAAAEEIPDVPETPSPEEEARLDAWLSALPGVTGPDTMLAYFPGPDGSIDLTRAHASGLAQLLAGRRTRLSTLLRDRQDYTRAARAARNLRSKSHELANERGVDAGHLAAGLATWTSAVGGKPRRISAPVLLTAIALTVRPEQDDFELKLTEQAKVNPALVRHLRTVHRIDVDAPAIERLAYSTARLDPQPVLERIRMLVAPIAGAEVESRLLVSTFADLEESLEDPSITAVHPILAALASTSGSVHVAPEPLDESRFPELDARDPEDEFLVLDADADQQLVIDAVRAGDSLVVEAPPGTGQTQTAVNALATLVDSGRSVLVIAERRASLAELHRECDALGLGSLVLQLGATLSPGQLRQQVVRAIVRNEKSHEPHLAGMYRVLRERRHQLIDHVESLHNVRERWGCSPYEAMQSLAALTSLHPAPATTVRLKRSVLDSIRDRAELSERLRRTAELGSFSRAASESPWHGARLVTRRETDDARELAARLATEVPALEERMRAVAEHAAIRLERTVAGWGRQLELLVAVRESLDNFTPDIFDRPVTDLIAATAPAAWRRERGIEVTAIQRSRLRRVAKEYVRPGVHLADLHSALALVQSQREAWATCAVSQRHPSVPSGLAELREAYLSVERGLRRLGTTLAPTAFGGRLLDSDVNELTSRLDALAEDSPTLRSLPERTLLEDELSERGLGDLLSDLTEREAPAAVVASELELAWWQSVLEAMISGDDYLAMSDGEQLRQAESEFVRADRAHIASGAVRLRWRLAREWSEAIERHAREAESLRALLKDGRISLSALERQCPRLIRPLVPVWTCSPYALTAALPHDRRFDAVLILDADSMPLRAALPAIARADQIIAFGDPQVANPRPFSVCVESQPGQSPVAEVDSALVSLSRVLPSVRLRTMYRSVDEDLDLQLSRRFYAGSLRGLPDGASVTGLDRPFLLEYLADGTGLPSGEDGGVESVAAEVNRVVDLVFDHAQHRPEVSLAVVTASAHHAARVGEAIRLQMANHPEVASFFSGGEEPFRVVHIDRAGGLVRDHVIFSLGFGRTPHGRAMHNFGPLSEPGGRRRFALAMSRARQSLHVLSCFQPSELDVTRLSEGASDFYELLDRELSGNSHLGSPATRAAASAEALGADPLVTDLGERLASRGARVWHHYDGAVDMAAAIDPLLTIGRDDHEPTAPIAVESDGTERYRRLSVRERTRQRAERLERRGWKHFTLWTIEVFTDPSSCAEMIATELGLETHAEDGGPAGFLTGAPAFWPVDEGNRPADDAGARPRSDAGPRSGSGEEDAPRSEDEAMRSTSDHAENARDGQGPAPTASVPSGSAAGGAQGGGAGRPDGPGAPARADSAEAAAGQSADGPDGASGVTSEEGDGEMRRLRGPRRATVPGTGPTAADEPEAPQVHGAAEPTKEGGRGDERDRWLKEQRPPHWG
ncbi:DUF4011 domain-containing protein [Sinomonas sp. ASV486]|uniref:DUF4011 domain-containing protein n=1 Tax=Sinomonas sp. ASV486 TaxID=3051170 RepID=UPI0027DD2775|nr:DUF4011 domain-containing protein [Sinomonas sp. ASV486]MDQ4491164.1 DUF4011 domain-containing protein [Sinomonas sp. ASV486]